MATSWPPMDRRGPSITVDHIRRFEQVIGAELPDDYRAFLLDLNGGRSARSHRTFVIRRAGKHRDETTLDTLHSLDDPDEDRDLAAHQLLRREDYPENGLRIGHDAFGAPLVLILTGARRGEVWYFDVEDDSEDRPVAGVDWFARRDVWSVATSFREFMASLGPLDAP